MGTGFRMFIVGSDDSLRPISYARFERLVRGQGGESLPEFAGRRLRCAKVILELKNRKPVRIGKVDYFILPLDKKGRVIAAELTRAIRLALDSIPVVAPPGKKSNVIDAQYLFAQRRYEHEFKWKPSRRIEEAISTEIFAQPTTRLSDT